MPNDMRDWLRELIDTARRKYWVNMLDETHLSEFMANYLIANGVILPPCKVGDINYAIGKLTGQIIPNEVINIEICKNDIYLINENHTVVSVKHQLGKTIFLTKEEAEKALKERGGDNNG